MPQPIASEGGERVVKTGESWFSIARDTLGYEATEPQVAAYAQEIARINGGLTLLRSNRTIRLPQTIVGENAAPTSEFMAAARGELADYKAGTFDPSGTTQAYGATQSTAASRPAGQSIYPTYDVRQTQAMGTTNPMLDAASRYADAGAGLRQAAAPSSANDRFRQGQYGAQFGRPSQNQSRLSATGNAGDFSGAINLARAALTPVFAPGSQEEAAFQSLQASLSRLRNDVWAAGASGVGRVGAMTNHDSFLTPSQPKNTGQSPTQPQTAGLTQQQQRGLEVAAQQYGGNLPSPQTQLAELNLSMAQGVLPPAIYATVAYGAGLTAEQLIARGYEFTNTGFWVYAQDDVDMLPEATSLFDNSPLNSGASYGINPGYYGAPLGLEPFGGFGGGGGDVNGGYSEGAYSSPYSGRAGSSNISWRIGIS